MSPCPPERTEGFRLCVISMLGLCTVTGVMLKMTVAQSGLSAAMAGGEGGCAGFIMPDLCRPTRVLRLAILGIHAASASPLE